MPEQDSMAESTASYEGASGGSTGGASRSDLRRGFTDADAPRQDQDFGMDSLLPAAEPERPQGFLDRPQGWER